MDAYAVVEFVDEQSVEAVPRTWIHVTDEAIMCYWPPSEISRRAKRGELPDKDRWKKYAVRVFSFTASYGQALERSKTACITSNVDTDGELGHRNSSIPQRYRESTSDRESSEHENGDDEDDEPREKRRKKNIYGEKTPSHSVETPHKTIEVLPVPTPPENRFSTERNTPTSTSSNILLQTTPSRSSSKNNRRQGTPSQPLSDAKFGDGRRQILSPSPTPQSVRREDVNLETQSVRNPTLIPSTQSSLLRALSLETEKLRQDSHDNFQKVLMKLDTIIDNQREMLSLQRRTANVSKAVDGEDLEDVIPAPMDSARELDAMCQKMKDDVDCKKKLVYHLSTLGGINPGENIRRMMRHLGTNTLWSSYSLKGRKGKSSLKELPIYRVLIKACLRNHKAAKLGAIEEAIASTLKYAPHKPGGDKYKVPASKTMPDQLGEALLDPSGSENELEVESPSDV